MKKSINATMYLAVIFMSIFLTYCSSPTQLPPDAEKALESYWQSLPSHPTITHQILQVWQGVVPAETTTPRTSIFEVWCVETEITEAVEVSIIGETVTWIVFRDDEEADWMVAMLATMSSTWPYEACGKGP
ncbi:MAG: hypothetical protein JSV61_04105 [Anaerolineales bacterium]|nr:MAG: hypothetical protein JSV61_04105 [Anaerolineales bacterium]